MSLRIKSILLVAVLAAGIMMPFAGRASSLSGFWGGNDERTLSFYNTHTREYLTTTYWHDGHYDPNELEKLNVYLRDHRNGHVHEMSYQLMNLLDSIKTELQRRHPDKKIVFNVISGFRSQATNDMLRANGGGQAKHSQHILGHAIDIRIPGIDITEIRDVAWCLQRGGVGYYRGSNFVHVDVAKVRYWNWTPKRGMCDGGADS